MSSAFRHGATAGFRAEVSVFAEILKQLSSCPPNKLERIPTANFRWAARNIYRRSAIFPTIRRVNPPALTTPPSKLLTLAE
jgi:hypothetical protein